MASDRTALKTAAATCHDSSSPVTVMTRPMRSTLASAGSYLYPLLLAFCVLLPGLAWSSAERALSLMSPAVISGGPGSNTTITSVLPTPSGPGDSVRVRVAVRPDPLATGNPARWIST